MEQTQNDDSDANFSTTKFNKSLLRVQLGSVFLDGKWETIFQVRLKSHARFQHGRMQWFRFPIFRDFVLQNASPSLVVFQWFCYGYLPLSLNPPSFLWNFSSKWSRSVPIFFFTGQMYIHQRMVNVWRLGSKVWQGLQCSWVWKICGLGPRGLK